ncbi:MAG: TfoX family protein [Chloroflexi bacterium]|nr:TfoX family protein [Chloroflexota bacterium]
MAYDEGLAQRIAEALDGDLEVVVKKMFGGVSFLVRGNMAVGVIKDELCVRVDPEQFEDLLSLTNTRIFDFNGRPIQGWLMVHQDGLGDDAELSAWIARGVEFALSLPAK